MAMDGCWFDGKRSRNTGHRGVGISLRFVRRRQDGRGNLPSILSACDAPDRRFDRSVLLAVQGVWFVPGRAPPDVSLDRCRACGQFLPSVAAAWYFPVLPGG